MSSALLVPGAVVVTAYRIIYGLHRCLATIRNRVTVHIVYPLSHPPEDNHLEQYLIQALRTLPNCEKLVTKGRIKSKPYSSWNYANIKVQLVDLIIKTCRVGMLSAVIRDFCFLTTRFPVQSLLC